MHLFKKLLGVGVGVVLLSSLATPTFATSSLTSAQVSGIIGLLQAFNADASVIANVQKALGSQPTVPTATFTSGAGIASPPVQNIQPLINGFDIYSPESVIFNGAPRLYFGGWLSTSDLPHDGIYVADCTSGAGSCTNVRKVIDAIASKLYQINDPSIVLVPANGATPAYYILYMTGSTDTTLDSNNIYYSTSWANDGINWSNPTLLLRGYWLPSATSKSKNGTVQLFANSTTDGRVALFNLGAGGLQVNSPTYVTFDNPAAYPAYYSNVNVVWRPTLQKYQILAERLQQQTINSSSVIDYLTSDDGAHWHLQNPAVISPQPGEYRVGTPAQWPDSAAWVYFGSTKAQDSTGFRIFFSDITHELSTPIIPAPVPMPSPTPIVQTATLVGYADNETSPFMTFPGVTQAQALTQCQTTAASNAWALRCVWNGIEIFNNSATTPAPVPTPTPPTTNTNPLGYFDAVSCTDGLLGWAYDPDAPTQSLDIHLYKDAPAGQGTFVDIFKANTSRTDVNAYYHITGNHGFVIPMPPSLKDGKPHTLYLYATDSLYGSDHNPLITNSPQTITCDASSTTASIRHTLAQGWTGPEVLTLQTVLTKLGLFKESITGYFGQATKAAVENFQSANNLSAVGIVGPKTRGMLLGK